MSAFSYEYFRGLSQSDISDKVSLYLQEVKLRPVTRDQSQSVIVYRSLVKTCAAK